MEDIVLVLVGNKKDLNESRQVFIEDINKWREKVNNIKYYEVSAFTGEGVTEMFNESIKETIELIQRREKEKENNKQTKDNKKMTNLLSGENENKKCC
jgi:GTPase SAR1 family protein